MEAVGFHHTAIVVKERTAQDIGVNAELERIGLSASLNGWAARRGCAVTMIWPKIVT